MSSAHFDLEQSLLDSLSYDKTDPEALINDPQHNAYFNLQGIPTTTASDLAAFPSFFAPPGSLGLNDPSNFNGLTPQLDQDQTPASLDSVSLSPHSPLQTAANFFNQSFAYTNQLNGNTTTTAETPSLLSNGHEKRKASVVAPVPAADAKKVAKLIKPPTGKKPGRKADNSEPANKKKAQNRAAQRAFRERKEKHLKDLEDRVSELEAESHATSSENDFLRQQVSRLQTELKKYRASRGSKSSVASGSTNTTTTTTNVGASPNSQFTFEFPFFQRSKSGASGSASYVKSSARSDSEKSSPASLLSPTSGIGSVSSASSSQSPETAKSVQSDPGEENFCDNLNLACGTRENPIPQAGAKGETPLLISALQAGNEFPQLPSSSSINTIKPANPIDVISPPMFELDFLSDYRDPIFDSEDFSLPDLTTENSLFDPLAAPHSLTGVSPATVPEPEDEETVPASSNNLMSCTAVWDRISAHPKFGDLDIDGLCAELRTKAKCSETGVVLSENDVNSVLKTLHH